MSLRRAPTVLLVSTISVIAASLFTVSAHACSCTYTPTVPVAKANAEALFTGRVLEVEVGEFGNVLAKRVVLLVDAVWKGNLSDQVTIYTGVWDGDCGIDFQLDVDYLVYADEYGTPESSRLYTYMCGRTALAAGNPDYRELGPPQTVDTLPASWGRIKQIWR